MRPTVVVLTLAILSLSCSDDQPTSPGSATYPEPELLFVTFGHELATEENWAIHFEAYPSQDTISLAYGRAKENVALRIYENHLMAYASPPPKAQLKLFLTTRRDHEDLQGGANLFIRGMGWGTTSTAFYFSFTSIIPARQTAQVTTGNDTLEFSSTEDDFLIVNYESPTSHRTLVDTLIITKSN
jgi:hypothetical protein